MFKIGKLFHVIHIVDDLDAADRWYDGVFAVTRFMKGYSPAEKRDASLVLIGDFVMEPMSPAKVEGAERMPVGRFHARFGQHLHSIAWYVSDIAALYGSLRSRNVRIFGDGGVALTKPPSRGGMFTHPRDTSCQLEFMESATGAAGDPRFQPGWSPQFWRDQHPLGIERTSHISVVVADLAKARAFYQSVLNGRLLQEGDASEKGKSAYLFVGEDTVVELLQPASKGSLAGVDLERHGEILHAVTFKVKDVDAAEGYLRGKKVRTERLDRDTLVLNREDAFGAVLAFTQRPLPSDPRS